MYTLLQPGASVGKPEILFARIDIPKKLEEIKAAEAAKKKEAQSPKAPEGLALISIDDFSKVALRVGRIKACEPLAGSDKLLKLTVDNGAGTKQVLSGIAAYYRPEELTGKKIILVDNLKPAKLRGALSEGMLLAADTENGVKVLFLDDSLQPGAVIR